MISFTSRAVARVESIRKIELGESYVDSDRRD